MDLEGLQQLQEIDIQRDQAKRELQAVLDQISDPPFIEQLEAEIEAQEEAARQADQGVREAHAIVQTAQRRIEVTDNRLYSGSITDHRTLEELQRDLYSQRQQLPPLADAETRAGDDAQKAHEASAWLKQLRTDALDVWNARQSELQVERDGVQERVDEFSRQVEILRDKLSQEDLATYDQYRRRRPRVVSTVAGGVCAECRLTLPTIVVTRARRGSRAVECPSCGCLLRVT
jgi:predicted  nucleic acid-binding Zn-ribbon protein